jgi:hypothetical protein
VEVHESPTGDVAQEIVRMAAKEDYDVIILGQTSQASSYDAAPFDVNYVLQHAPCWVCLAIPTAIPREVDDT